MSSDVTIEQKRAKNRLYQARHRAKLASETKPAVLNGISRAELESLLRTSAQLLDLAIRSVA